LPQRRCHHQRPGRRDAPPDHRLQRVTQQSAATVIDREFAAYWITRIREVRRAGWSDLRSKSVDPREQSKMKLGRLKPGAGCAGYRGKGSGEHESSGERGRRRTRQEQISLRALAPVKLRISWGDPHRTKKTRFFCRIGLKERTPTKDDPAV